MALHLRHTISRRRQLSRGVKKAHHFLTGNGNTSLARCEVRTRSCYILVWLSKRLLRLHQIWRQQRLTLEETGRILSRREGRFSRDIEVMNLKISHATSIQHFDRKVAAELESPCSKPLQIKTLPINDGTNACAFLSVSIAERILHESEIDDFFGNFIRRSGVNHFVFAGENKQSPGSRIIFFENSTSLSLY